MHDVIHPSAEEIWESVGVIMTIEGEQEIAPQSDEEWSALESHAAALMEAGSLLMMEGRAKDGGRWMERSRNLVEAAAEVRIAVRARDAGALFEAGGVVFDACQGCHWDYRFEDDPATIRTH